MQIALLNYSGTCFQILKQWTNTQVATWRQHICSRAVAKQITSELKEELLLTRWYRLVTDGSSDKDDKFLPILVRKADKVSGLIVTSLLDMPNITSGSTAQQMYVCYEVREAFSLDWNNCVMYSSDNINSMIGQHNKKSEKNRIFIQKIWNPRGDQKIFDVGCPCDLAHLWAGMGAKERSVNVEGFVIDIYYQEWKTNKPARWVHEL